MRIQDIITESKWGQRRVPLSDYNKFHERIQPAREAWDQGRRIYRGMHIYNADFFYQPQMQPGARKSANVYNWYTLIMDNTPEWRDFPARSASVICTSDPIASSDYGVTFQVLPFGDPIIGICPTEDIWFSFPRLKTVDMESLEDLIDALETLQNMYLEKNLSQDSWPDFTRGLNVLTQKILQNYTSSKSMSANKLQGRVTPQKDMLTSLRELLDPQASGFKTARLSQWQAQPQREIWFSAGAFFLQSTWLAQAPGKNLDDKIKHLIDVYGTGAAGPM